MNRAPRTTILQRLQFEANQSAVIATLIASGEEGIAGRLARCQQARLYRSGGWPWRCHGSGCWACRRHDGIDRHEVWTILERRWPEIMLSDPGNTEPLSAMTVEAAINIALKRRSIQPITIVILPQGAAANDPWAEAMPMLF